jgi:hypothetical protein
MQTGVGVVGGGMGLLIGLTTKWDSIVLGVGVGVVYKQGFRIQGRVAKCTWDMSRKF